MKPVINSRKHYVQTTFSEANTLTENDETLVIAVDAPATTNPFNVQEGAIIKAIFWELWVLGSTQDAFFTIIFAKYPGGVNAATFTEMTDLNTWDNKKNILYTTQGLAPNESGAGPMAVYKGWIKIPKSKQRFGLGDQIKFQVASRGVGDINYCGFSTYKEYT